IAEQQRGEKAFVFGTGYSEGNKITLGCSYKGRIWSYLRSDIKEFIRWCNIVGEKLIDLSIDPNQLLKHTLIPKSINQIPSIHPTHIDWNDNFYLMNELKVNIRDNNDEINIAFCELHLIDYSVKKGIEFDLITPVK